MQSVKAKLTLVTDQSAPVVARADRLLKLEYNPGDNEIVRTVKRYKLMAIAAEKAFDHLYTQRGVRASEEAYDLSHAARKELKSFPSPAALARFQVTKKTTVFTITDLTVGSTFDVLDRDESLLIDPAYRGRVIQAKLAAAVEFLYHWTIELAGERPKTYRRMFNPDGATLEAETVKNLMQPYVEKIRELAENVPQQINHLLSQLFVNTRTGFPLNIRIPF